MNEEKRNQMSQYLFEPSQVQSLPVRGDASRFPVRRIYCVGRNYTDHIVEMGGDVRELPFFFQKPADALVQDGASVPYPAFTADFQYEVELVLAMGSSMPDSSEASAREAVFGFAVGIDLTRRDVQIAARKAGRPWEIGKSFDHSAPCSELIAVTSTALPDNGAIELKVDGITKQAGDILHMIWKPFEIVSKLSEQYELKQGDLIYTGTPAGVGGLARGNKVTATFRDLCALSISIS